MQQQCVVCEMGNLFQQVRDREGEGERGGGARGEGEGGERDGCGLLCGLLIGH